MGSRLWWLGSGNLFASRFALLGGYVIVRDADFLARRLFEWRTNSLILRIRVVVVVRSTGINLRWFAGRLAQKRDF